MKLHSLKNFVENLAVILVIGISAILMVHCIEGQVESSEGRTCSCGTAELYQQPPLMPPPMPCVVKLLLDQMEANVIAKLAGAPIDVIRKELTAAPVPEVLEERGLSPDAFFKAMDEQSEKLIRQVVTANLITKKEGDDILKGVNQMAAHREEAALFEDLDEWEEAGPDFMPEPI
jgi:hypothetical protein